MKDREFCTSLRLFITCQKPPLFVKALCSAHTKDYYAVHFKYFVVFLPFDSTSSWMGSPRKGKQEDMVGSLQSQRPAPWLNKIPYLNWRAWRLFPWKLEVTIIPRIEAVRAEVVVVVG